MEISIEEVKKIAKLAAIKLDETELPKIAEDLQHILQLVDKMQAFTTTDVAPMLNPLPQQQNMREDEVTENPNIKALQACAPEIQDELYIVPKVVGS